MNYITLPNLPKNKVTLFIADTAIPDAEVITPPEIKTLPPGISCHADLGICVVSGKKAVCPPETFEYYKEKLSPYGFEIIKGKTKITSNYPGDSAYNVGIVGKKCFLNKNVCDSQLSDILISEGYELVHVNQGYAKCSICPVDENSFITADKGIADCGEKKGMEVLLITNDSILLPGYKNGFFGGCCGLGGSDVLLVNGEIKTHPDYEKIVNFLQCKGIYIKNLKKGNIIDIGSILPLMTT